MARWLIGIGVAGAVVMLLVRYAQPAFVWLQSEAILDRRYTLPRSLVVADKTRDGISRGGRLVRLAGCTGCHGPDLLGRELQDPIAISASNLKALTPIYADEDFDRAIRRGLRPDASSLWVMPSQAYLYVRDHDIGAILGYLRALKPQGALTSPLDFSETEREKIVSGKIQPTADLAQMQMPALSLGPHYSGGRYIAMFACGSCHGTELAGSADHRVPDLNMVTRYSRSQFFNLLRKGWGLRGRRLRVMSPLALQRFHILMDWEIDPLYAYLTARANAPAMDQISAAIR